MADQNEGCILRPMKLWTIIFLVLGILFFHAAGTINFILDKVSCQQAFVSAEEEETHNQPTLKGSCDALLSNADFMLYQLAQLSVRKFEYAQFHGSLFVRDRVEMPPEVC